MRQNNVQARQIAPEQQNAMREQIIINTRLTALQVAQDMTKVNAITPVAGEELLAYAKKVEEYILSGIESVKPKSGLVVTNAMPPQGVFTPGE